MKAQALYPIINCQNYGIAATLEQLMFHTRRAGGETQIRLGFLSRFVKRSTSAISRYLQWLSEQGFIRVRKEWRGSACILFVRVLVRLRPATSTQPDRDGRGTALGRSWDGILKEHKETPKGGNTEALPENRGASILEIGIRGSLSGVEERMQKRRDAVAEKKQDEKPTPQAVAHEWVRLLAQYGYAGFPATKARYLAPIKKTIALFDKPTVAEFVIELERRILLWQTKRPSLLSKAPPHPWAINRTDILFQRPLGTETADNALYPGYTPLTPEPIYQEPAPTEPSSPSSVDIPVVLSPRKARLLRLSQSGNSAE